MKSVREEIIGIVSSVINVDSTEIESGLITIEELDLDSLQLYEMIISIEEIYNIRLSDEAIDSILTIDDFVNLVESIIVDKN